jgi:hypothetical protein
VPDTFLLSSPDTFLFSIYSDIFLVFQGKRVGCAAWEGRTSWWGVGVRMQHQSGGKKNHNKVCNQLIGILFKDRSMPDPSLGGYEKNKGGVNEILRAMEAHEA